MRQLVQAEFLKLRTTRLLYGLLITSVVLTALMASVSILTGDQSAGKFALTAPEGVKNGMGSGWPTTVLVLILGILMMAGEFRHDTVTSAFLATPERRRVVWAKMITCAIVGLAFGLVACAFTLAISVPWLAAKDINVALTDSDVGPVLIGFALATSLYGMVGVGVGALVRNPTAAIIGVLVWSLMIEFLLLGSLPEVGKWLPGGANQSLAGSVTSGGGLLPPWAGGLLLLGYVAAFAAVANRFTVRSDVT